MRRLTVCLSLLAALMVAPQARAGSATCFGNFANPITDICWACLFPISIGAISFDYGQEDIENPASPICICPIATPPYYRIGLSIGFWEPTRIIETTRTPFCFPALAGYSMGLDYETPEGARDSPKPNRPTGANVFYQAHYYLNPVLYYLEVLTDDLCLEAGSFDLAYMTEYDPTWHDDVDAAILEPEAALFANLAAVAACAADCVAASAGFGLAPMFWCSGCQGGLYPMNGNVAVRAGAVQASALIAHRMLAKLHRQFIAWQHHGSSALCGAHPAPLMDKRGYKTQILYPIPMTGGSDGSGPNRCCQPLGRTTALWGMGREFPIRGEDMAFQVWRKRNCCAF